MPEGPTRARESRMCSAAAGVRRSSAQVAHTRRVANVDTMLPQVDPHEHIRGKISTARRCRRAALTHSNMSGRCVGAELAEPRARLLFRSGFARRTNSSFRSPRRRNAVGRNEMVATLRRTGKERARGPHRARQRATSRLGGLDVRPTARFAVPVHESAPPPRTAPAAATQQLAGLPNVRPLQQRQLWPSRSEPPGGDRRASR
jgi:hypothetical protein